jgi:hypothetical protein
MNGKTTLTDLTDPQMSLLRKVAKARKGYVDIKNGRQTSAWISEYLRELGLLQIKVFGTKLRLRLTDDGQTLASEL